MEQKDRLNWRHFVYPVAVVAVIAGSQNKDGSNDFVECMRDLMFSRPSHSYKTTFFDTAPVFMTRTKPAEVIHISKMDSQSPRGIVVYQSDRPEKPVTQNIATKPKEEKQSLVAAAFTTAKDWFTGGIANAQTTEPERPDALRKTAKVSEPSPAGTSQN